VKFASATVGLRAQSVSAGEARTAPGTRSTHDALKKGTYTGTAGDSKTHVIYSRRTKSSANQGEEKA
jgi:hypothetical protein